MKQISSHTWNSQFERSVPCVVHISWNRVNLSLKAITVARLDSKYTYTWTTDTELTVNKESTKEKPKIYSPVSLVLMFQLLISHFSCSLLTGHSHWQSPYVSRDTEWEESWSTLSSAPISHFRAQLRESSEYDTLGSFHALSLLVLTKQKSTLLYQKQEMPTKTPKVKKS